MYHIYIYFKIKRITLRLFSLHNSFSGEYLGVQTSAIFRAILLDSINKSTENNNTIPALIFFNHHQKINIILKSQQYRYCTEISNILFSQLGTVGNDLINCVRQELDGITEWFIC